MGEPFISSSPKTSLKIILAYSLRQVLAHQPRQPSAIFDAPARAGPSPAPCSFPTPRLCPVAFARPKSPGTPPPTPLAFSRPFRSDFGFLSDFGIRVSDFQSSLGAPVSRQVSRRPCGPAPFHDHRHHSPVSPQTAL